jgi:hypothetical protein
MEKRYHLAFGFDQRKLNEALEISAMEVAK